MESQPADGFGKTVSVAPAFSRHWFIYCGTGSGKNRRASPDHPILKSASISRPLCVGNGFWPAGFLSSGGDQLWPGASLSPCPTLARYQRAGDSVGDPKKYFTHSDY